MSPWINVRLGFSSKTITRVVECPGLWMNEHELAEILNDMKKLVAEHKLGEVNYGILSGEKTSVQDCVLTLIYDKAEGHLLAFNAMMYLPCKILNRTLRIVHLGLVVVAPQHQAKGLSWSLYSLSMLLLCLRYKFRNFWISSVSQVPAIIGVVCEGFYSVYPNPASPQQEPSSLQSLIARELMLKHRAAFGVGVEARFNEKNFIIEESYTGGSQCLKKSYESTQKHRKQIYNEFAQNSLNYSRGDDFLQIGQMGLSCYIKYLYKHFFKKWIF